MKTLQIGSKEIGPGLRPLVIAEMSGNHNGSLATALQIVRSAAASGADAIKLQTFSPGTLTIDSRRPEFFIDDPGSLWHARRLWELYEEAHTPWDWHAPIFDLARSLGLACISTAFDDSSVRFLESLEVDALKVASFELIHLPLLAAVARGGRPVLLSTGMATLEEIEAAVTTLRIHGCEGPVLLKCTSAYPAVERDADLATLPDLRARFGCQVGLSDHTLRPLVAFAAAALGAVVIEKHVTIARSAGGVDAAFSLEPAELRELVDGVAQVHESLGEVNYGPRDVEATSLRERPSIYVVQPMRKGDRFTVENVRIIRPSSGLAPAHLDEILGLRCARDVAEPLPLSWDLVEGCPEAIVDSIRAGRK